MAKTIAELKAELKSLPLTELAAWIENHRNDERSGVQKLLQSADKKLNKQRMLYLKLKQMAEFDAERGKVVIGLDEAGRGPLAGPVVAAACIIEPHLDLLGLDDSKKLSAAKRDYYYDVITRRALYYDVGIVDAETIDKINILEATKLAMQKSLKNADKLYDAVLTDYVFLKNLQASLYAEVKGDQKSLAIAAASIIAKVTRDRILEKLALDYPQYSFDKHKGYGTAQHYEALRLYGAIEKIHRKSFLKG